MNQAEFNFDPPTFDGATFDYDQDHTRLKTSLERVAALMADGKPRTLREIADAVGCSEAGASARLRDLRKAKFWQRFGHVTIHSERLDGGLWVYQLDR